MQSTITRVNKDAFDYNQLKHVHIVDYTVNIENKRHSDLYLGDNSSFVPFQSWLVKRFLE